MLSLQLTNLFEASAKAVCNPACTYFAICWEQHINIDASQHVRAMIIFAVMTNLCKLIPPAAEVLCTMTGD